MAHLLLRSWTLLFITSNCTPPHSPFQFSSPPSRLTLRGLLHPTLFAHLSPPLPPLRLPWEELLCCLTRVFIPYLFYLVKCAVFFSFTHFSSSQLWYVIIRARKCWTFLSFFFIHTCSASQFSTLRVMSILCSRNYYCTETLIFFVDLLMLYFLFLNVVTVV